MCTASALALGLAILCGPDGAGHQPSIDHPPNELRLVESTRPDGQTWHMIIDVGSSESLDLVLPAGFGLGAYEGSTMEFTKAPETVDDWTVIITMMVFQHYTGSLSALRMDMSHEFFKTCKTRNALSTRFPLREKDGMKIMEWVVSCDLILSGPSKGKPETTLYHFISGRESDIMLSVGLRWIPTAKDIETWKTFLDQSKLSPRGRVERDDARGASQSSG